MYRCRVPPLQLRSASTKLQPLEANVKVREKANLNSAFQLHKIYWDIPIGISQTVCDILNTGDIQDFYRKVLSD